MTTLPILDEAAARAHACPGCRDDAPALAFSMAYQPIVDLSDRSVFGYEALVRGLNGESAASVLGQVTEANRYRFDQDCRQVAVSLAARLGLGSVLSINFMPGAVYRPEVCIQSTLRVARDTGTPTSRIMFEISEAEGTDAGHIAEIFREYRKRGFITALDDFGAGHSNLSRLVELEPDLVKIDMSLIRDIDRDARRRTTVSALARLCEALGARVIAEGIETVAESVTLHDLGIPLQQGYLFGRPQFERLAAPTFP